MGSGSRTTYPTWIRGRRIATFWGLAAILVAASVATALWWTPALCGLLLAVPVLYVALVITLTSYRLSPQGDDVQAQVHQLLVEAVGGGGKALDIGCGSGELLIRLGRTGEHGPDDLVGLDFWGDDWAFSQEQAEANARAEGMPGLRFVRGTASRLPFADGEFARVVSALTFHEVHDVDDKTVCVDEAVRVLAPGGTFAVVDLFDDPRIYGSRGRVEEAISRAGGSLSSSTRLADLITLRWPLTLRQALKHAVVMTGTRT